MGGALDGIRIIDLSTVIAGPLCARILADYGADVIKVEPPGGDLLRISVPARNAKMGVFHLSLNRNKRLITLDLKKPEAIEVVLKLAAQADVLIHNMRPQALDRLGLSYESLNRINPKLVLTNIIGFGRAGRYRDRPAYDDLIQAMSGIASLSTRDGKGPPRYLPLNAVDRLTAVTAAHATLAALLRSHRTGRGQAVEIPMFENAVEFMLGDHMAGAFFEPALGGIGNQRAASATRRPFPTADGAICVVPYSDKHWREFFQITVREDCGRDPRFSTHEARVKHAEAVLEMMAGILKTRSTAQWLEAFSTSQIPHGPMNTLEDLLEDPHLNDVGFFARRTHPTEGDIVVPRPAVWMSETPPELRSEALQAGSATRDVLKQLGYADRDIERIIEIGAAQASGQQGPTD